MKLNDLLTKKRSTILRRWFDVIIESYPPDTSHFFKTQKDQFANPVGHAISQGIGGLLEEIIQGVNPDNVPQFLDDIIRVKAIQDFTPSQAISFIFLLKKVIRQELSKEIQDPDISKELLALESRIDDLALLSFDIYMKCRQKIFEIRVNEVRNMTNRLLRMANLVYDRDEQRPDNESETLITNNIKG
ncbi:MAG: RsbRD N-terminal domain-containing protein [Nitrospirota bacterium]